MASIPTQDPTPIVYFESSWSILSSIGLMNVLYGGLVVGITSLSPITIVPIVVSAASAVANGLCYYSVYSDYEKLPRLIAGIFADLLWLVQEAGLSFYSYQILNNILLHREKRIFLALFWSVMSIIVILRMTILVTRAIDNLSSAPLYLKRISTLHIGYFVAIAVVEGISSVFLLRVFAAAKKASLMVSTRSSLFRHLTRSTEIRLATLALIGITRAVTYSFQTTSETATTAANQVDRFVYTLECLFPLLLMIDILGSKIASTDRRAEELPLNSKNQTQKRHSNGFGTPFYRANSASEFPTQGLNGHTNANRNSMGKVPTHPMPAFKTVISARGRSGSSEEWIMEESIGTEEQRDKQIAVSVDQRIEFEHIELGVRK